MSKDPLGVEQLDKTQCRNTFSSRIIICADSIKVLEVAGKAVEAEFERNLRDTITKRDYFGDLEEAIYQICRQFKEEKKNCGTSWRHGSKPWDCHVPGLKANRRKGIEKNCMKFDR